MHWNNGFNSCGITGWFYNLSWFIPIIVVACWLVVAYLIYKVVSSSIAKRNNNAIKILENRLASGEITIEEYIKIKKIL